MGEKQYTDEQKKATCGPSGGGGGGGGACPSAPSLNPGLRDISDVLDISDVESVDQGYFLVRCVDQTVNQVPLAPEALPLCFSCCLKKYIHWTGPEHPKI